MRSFLFIYLLFLFTPFYGQSIQLLDTTDYAQRKSLKENYQNKFKEANRNIKSTYRGKLRKEVLDFYEGSQEYFLSLIEKKKLLFDKRFQKYVDSLYKTLQEKNEQLKGKNIKFLIAKNPNPNAVCLIDGTIIIHIGLFYFLENEYQLQSVMSHEIGHYLLKHPENNVIKKAEANINVINKQSEIAKSIRKQKFNTSSSSIKYLKDILYRHGKEDREQEMQADSLGYIIYKKVNSKRNHEYVNSLRLLNSMESITELIVNKKTYETVFNISNQPFKKDWLVNESFEGYNYSFYKEKINKDSLKTHPEASLRIENLQHNFKELKTPNSKTKPNERFLELKNIAKKSHVENLYNLKEYGSSVFLILNKLEHTKDDTYLKKWLGLNFTAIYEAKKKYQLNRHVDRVFPNKQRQSYINFLNFIWNLELNEIKLIADYYNKT
jgi:Zn-dependent protease with chaperone function